MSISNLYDFVKHHKSEDPGLTGKSELTWLAPDLIEEEEGFNLRDYERKDTVEHIEKLAQAWERGSQMPPLEVKIKGGRCFVRDGHCRLRGAKLAISRGAAIKRLTVIEFHGNDDAANVRLLTSNDSLKLTPIQRANGIQRLRNFGWSNDEIGNELNLSGTAIRDFIRLLTLPDELQSLIEDGVVKGYMATKMWREHGQDSIEILQKAADKMRQEMADAEQGDDQEGSKPTDPNASPGSATRKPSSISTKHLQPSTKRLSRKFVKTLSTQVSEMRAVMMKSAKPNAKSGTVDLKIPIEMYENFVAMASQLEDPKTEQANNDDKQAALDIVSLGS